MLWRNNFQNKQAPDVCSGARLEKWYEKHEKTTGFDLGRSDDLDSFRRL